MSWHREVSGSEGFAVVGFVSLSPPPVIIIMTIGILYKNQKGKMATKGEVGPR